MPKCLEGCTCGRHASYERTAAQRAAVSIRSKGSVRRSLADRFWSHVSKGDPHECWLWTGSTYIVGGYGKLFHRRNARGSSLFLRAHRVSWEIANGAEVPAGLKVLHSCDVPRCVNPVHLRLGTAAVNNADRAERKRGKEHRQNGEANDNAKLTEAQVRQIIAELQKLPRRSQASIAEEFGIKQPQVSRIMRRESWAHLWGDE